DDSEAVSKRTTITSPSRDAMASPLTSDFPQPRSVVNRERPRQRPNGRHRDGSIDPPLPAPGGSIGHRKPLSTTPPVANAGSWAPSDRYRPTTKPPDAVGKLVPATTIRSVASSTTSLIPPNGAVITPSRLKDGSGAPLSAGDAHVAMATASNPS